MQVDGFPIWVVLIGSVYPCLNREPSLSRRATSLPFSHTVETPPLLYFHQHITHSLTSRHKWNQQTLC